MHSQVFLRRGVLLGVVTTAALAALLPARAQVGEPKPAPAPQTSSATPACAVSAAQVRLNQPLPRLARRLAKRPTPRADLDGFTSSRSPAQTPSFRSCPRSRWFLITHCSSPAPGSSGRCAALTAGRIAPPCGTRQARGPRGVGYLLPGWVVGRAATYRCPRSPARSSSRRGSPLSSSSNTCSSLGAPANNFLAQSDKSPSQPKLMARTAGQEF